MIHRLKYIHWNPSTRKSNAPSKIFSLRWLFIYYFWFFNTNLNILHYSEKVDLLLQLTNLRLQWEWSVLFLPWSLIAGQLTNGLKNKIHEHNNHVFWVVIFINFSHQNGAIMGWKHFKKSIWTFVFTKCFIQFLY